LCRHGGAASRLSHFWQAKIHVMSINITDIFSFALIPSLSGHLPFRLLFLLQAAVRDAQSTAA
jgi:hypothetical protein